jgi:hypothetical protein
MNKIGDFLIAIVIFAIWTYVYWKATTWSFLRNRTGIIVKITDWFGKHLVIGGIIYMYLYQIPLYLTLKLIVAPEMEWVNVLVTYPLAMAIVFTVSRGNKEKK